MMTMYPSKNNKWTPDRIAGYIEGLWDADAACYSYKHSQKRFRSWIDEVRAWYEKSNLVDPPRPAHDPRIGWFRADKIRYEETGPE